MRSTARIGACLAVVLGLTIPTDAATNIVTSLADDGPGSLRQAIVDAAGGDTITFSVTGTITLTNGELVLDKDLTILGPGATNLVISGNSSARVLYVLTNVACTVANLTIAGGLSGHGAGIFNDGGTISLLNAVLGANSASEGASLAPEEYAGGALFNRGTVHATNCLFTGNEACASPFSYYPARGGAIRNEIGMITLMKCVFANNHASGFLSDYGPGTEGSGGAIYSQGSLHVRDCTFVQNSASGGAGWAQPSVCSACLGQSGGHSFGGAICNCNLGLLTIEGSLFVSNTVTGGDGSSGGGGFSCEEYGDLMNGAHGGAGGLSVGSSLFSEATADVLNSTFVWNLARGGAGGGGGRWRYLLSLP